jgi:histidine triad (HIT) family protein
MASVFSKIINREIPAHIVAEDEAHIAFLDITPVAIGHVLVVPKKETDYIFDIESAELGSLFSFAQKVAIGMKTAITCRRIGIAVIGLEVPHAHVHLVPLHTVEDINFAKPKLQVSSEDLSATAAFIQAAINS